VKQAQVEFLGNIRNCTTRYVTSATSLCIGPSDHAYNFMSRAHKRTQTDGGDIRCTGEDKAHWLKPARGDAMRAESKLGSDIAKPIGGTDYSHGFLACLRIEAINEDDPVEMIGLMLNATGHEISTFDGHRLAVHVHAMSHNSGCTWSFEGKPGQRKATLLAILEVIGQAEHWIAQVSEFIINPVREDS